MLSVIWVQSDGSLPHNWMIFKESCPRVLSWFAVLCGVHCASLFCWIPPWSLKWEYTSPAVAFAWRENYSYILNVKHLYRTMSSQSLHPDMTPDVGNFRSLANRPNQQQPGPSGNSQLPPAKRHVSVPAVERDSSQGGSSVASTIQGQNSTPSSLLNDSYIADITQRVTSTPSATQQRWIITPTANRVQAAVVHQHPTEPHRQIRRITLYPAPASGSAITPTPLSRHENLPTPIPNPEAHVIMTDAPQTRATEWNQRHQKWQLQLQAVSTPWWVVSGSHCIYQFGHPGMTRLVFATGRLLDLAMWNRRQLKWASDMDQVSYAMWHVAKALAEAPHLQMIEKYWNTAMQHSNICSLAFEVCTKEILKEVCWSNGLRWILHTETDTRFEHKSIRLNPILFNQQGTT